MSKILFIVTGSLFAYHLLEVWLNLHSSIHHYTVHLTLILIVCAVDWGRELENKLTGARQAITLTAVIILCVCIASGGLYLYAMSESLQLSQPFLTTGDYIVGVAMIIAVLLLNWKYWGTLLTGLCIAAGLYFWLGDRLPGIWKAPTSEPFVIVSYMAGLGTTRGILNYIPLSADTIVLLITYGGLLGSLRVIDMFNEIGCAISRLVKGGVAYSAVIASSLIGMVTGQAVSNIVLSGSMTIPTMTRKGFSGERAGAIECLASNGSQLLPPIMGLGAFLMAALLGVPYIEIVKAAIIPAILYVVIILISVSCVVRATPNLDLDDEEADWTLVFSVAPSFLISLGTIVYILSNHYSGGVAGSWGIAILVVLSFLRPKAYRPRFGDMTKGIVDGIVNASKLAVVLSAIGILVQTMTTTGLGFTLGRVMLEWSGGNLAIGLLLGMVISLLIGMGLPTPAAYTVIAIVVVPVLIDLGVPDLSAHFFGFYFGVFSSISPPIAVGVLTAVRISGCGFMATAMECMKLGSVGMILPFMFVFYPGTLDLGQFGVSELIAIVLILIATLMIGATFYGSLFGRLSVWERGILALGPITTVIYMFNQMVWLGLIGPAALIAIVAWRRANILRSAVNH